MPLFITRYHFIASRCPGMRLSTWQMTAASCPTALDALYGQPMYIPTCVVPRTFSSYGDRTFAAAGPHLWNSLRVQLRNPDITYGPFRRQLKSHLFGKAWTRHSVTSICRALEKHLLTYLLTYKWLVFYHNITWQISKKIINLTKSLLQLNFWHNNKKLVWHIFGINSEISSYWITSF